MENIGKKAKSAAATLNACSTAIKNDALLNIAKALEESTAQIIDANNLDIEKAKANDMPAPLLDRLTLDGKRIGQMAEGIRQVVALPDPIGEIIGSSKRENGLLVCKKRVPLGVVAIIYEARPNVTCDAAALCLKTANACILRGGSEAIETNKVLAEIMRNAICQVGLEADCIQLLQDTSRQAAMELMKLNGYVDVLIPRGGKGLIDSCVKNATVPLIETGTGNCHLYVDQSAQLPMALDILINGKTQRVGVCNALESLVVHKDIAQAFLPPAVKQLKEKGVSICGCSHSLEICPDIEQATCEDYATEYLDYRISVKIVDSIQQAIGHINQNSTKHSEAIVTDSYPAAQMFLDQIDSACVYVNASTRFTDGFEFGLGAEIGISTQKIHARGPMGLEQLSTIKYVIYGNGQIRK